MSFAVQERPLDVSFGQAPNPEQVLPYLAAPLGAAVMSGGDFIRSQYNENSWQSNNEPWQNSFGSMFGSFSANILQQLYQMLQRFFGGQTSGEQYFQNATGGSVGDPHLSFNGQTWNNMGSQPNLLSSDSISGGYQISTQATPPAANGVTYNQSATVTTNNGATNVTMNKDGNVKISQFGRSFSLEPGQSADLGNGEFVARNQDGSLAVTCNNGTGGNITTTMRSNGTGVDVNATANNVDLGGTLVNGPNAPNPVATPAPMPTREPLVSGRHMTYNVLDVK